MAHLIVARASCAAKVHINKFVMQASRINGPLGCGGGGRQRHAACALAGRCSLFRQLQRALLNVLGKLLAA